MNPQPELTFRIQTLVAEQTRRETELRRVIRERTARSRASRTASKVPSSGAGASTSAPARCTGAHATV